MCKNLQELEQRLAWERETLAYPDRIWPVTHTVAGNEPVLDVLFIGGGQTSIAIALRLLRLGVANFRIIDENPEGEEGPWVTYARMLTLRTEKRLHGPDGGFPSATFRAWYEAQYGAQSYNDLTLVPKEQWMEYLRWLRHRFGLPVSNGTKVSALIPHALGFRVELQGEKQSESIVARKIVMATGLGGVGGSRVPFDVSQINAEQWKHSRDMFDFTQLNGKRVAVVGGNASALDNAATALEAGASEVVQFIRRAQHPERNMLRYLEFAGMFQGFSLMPDSQKLEVARAYIENAVPPPLWSIDRCQAHANFSLRMGTGWRRLRQDGTEIVVELENGSEHRTDFIIFGTGFDVDLGKVDFLKEIADDILLWKDVAGVGRGTTDQLIGRHPYLGHGFECVGKRPETKLAMSNLIMANPSAVISAGPAAFGLNGSAFASTRVAQGIVESLYLQDAGDFISKLPAFEHSEFTGQSNLDRLEAI